MLTNVYCFLAGMIVMDLMWAKKLGILRMTLRNFWLSITK